MMAVKNSDDVVKQECLAIKWALDSVVLSARQEIQFGAELCPIAWMKQNMPMQRWFLSLHYLRVEGGRGG